MKHLASFGNGTCCYSRRSPYSKSISHLFGGLFVRGGKFVQNPTQTGGALTGATDTDYFYFHCPKCKGAMQFVVEELWEVPTRWKENITPPITQHLEIHVFCRSCKLGGRIAMNSDCVPYLEQRVT